jgi:glucose/arabinose dehydrogenase
MTALRWLAPVALAALSSATAAGTPPRGFVDAPVWSGIFMPTTAAYEPGTGNLWVIEKGGFGLPSTPPRVLVRQRTTGAVHAALALACVDARGERGLLGLAFSPAYLDGPASRHVYIYYTQQITATGACSIAGVPEGARNRVVRYLESDGALSGEEVVLDGPFLTSLTTHNGGTLRFGLDGTLFVSMGDNDTDDWPSPLSRDPTDLRGKLLRIRADGSVPEDNPFVNQPGHRPEIWALGLRNPFRFSIDPLTGIPFIADVGEATWEEIDVGAPGADYGYPCAEGPAPYRTCYPEPAPAGMTAPAYAYGHGLDTSPVSGNCVTGGPVVRHGGFPAANRDRYYFGDFGGGWIRSAAVDGVNTLTDVQMFVENAGPVVDILASPDGCLTYVTLLPGSVHEVCFDAALADLDGDGVSIAEGDCDDGNPSRHPGVPDLCDGIDNDCSGAPDDDACSRYEASGDDRVDGAELAWLGRAFGTCSDAPASAWWLGVDYDRDGCVGGDDLAVLGAVWACSGTLPVCGP